MKQKIIVRTEQLRSRAATICATIPLNEPHEVIIRPWKLNRSEQQNRFYWAVLTVIGNDLGMTKDEMHTEYKRRFLVPIFTRDDADYARMVDAVEQAGMLSEVVRLTSTTQASVAQMAEYLDDITHNAAELGIRLPAIGDFE